MCIDIDAENLALMLSYRVTRRDNRARRRVRIRCRPAAKLQLSELREHGRPPLSPPHPGNRACRQSHAQISESPAGPDAACSLQYARLTSTPRKLAPTRQRQAPPTSAAPPTPPHPQSPPPKGQPKKAGAGFLRSSHPSTPRATWPSGEPTADIESSLRTGATNKRRPLSRVGGSRQRWSITAFVVLSVNPGRGWHHRVASIERWPAVRSLALSARVRTISCCSMQT